MNEENNEEITKEIHIEDENFINTLSETRTKQSSKEKQELQELTHKALMLQQKLVQMKNEVRKEKTIYELDILSRILSDCNYISSSYTGVSDIQIAADKNIKTVLKAYEMILKREFGEFEE